MCRQDVDWRGGEFDQVCRGEWYAGVRAGAVEGQVVQDG